MDYVVTNPAIAGRALPSKCWRTATIPQADPTLTTQMKSVGEAMAIGRTFKEGEHTRLACRFRRPRRNHLPPPPDSFSRALNDARVGACAPPRPLEIGRSGF